MIYLLVFFSGFIFAFVIFSIICYITYKRKLSLLKRETPTIDISDYIEVKEYIKQFINSEDIENV